MTLAAIVLFALGWIPVFLHRSERVSEKLAVATAAERRWIPLTIVAIALHVTLVEIWLTTWTERPEPGARLAAGMAVFVAGLVWWSWARRHLGPFDRPLDPARPPDQLIVRGPFAVVRNPLALGTLIAALGPTIAAAAPITWATYGCVAICLARRCVQDEAELQRTFGSAYQTYVERTPRLVPFLW